ncbi:DUF6689 family protein [Pseudomarimonas salicorniae]|uniref:Uncharacterized protein n=1 Tax=Pseudomarimonas salicorniae TaxID=2933270 RepID=A0ABT0GK35_9GAMM|nr:DUF6689 family protein [Lysobacter sp. CAU 1642]MCK7594402.1 hypothetical protein [Lysobacter sp. CAU 1642]
MKSLQTLFALLCFSLAATAQAAVLVTVAGKSATAEIAIAGVEAELILNFSDVDQLQAGNLGISAQLVSVTDPALLARLPDASLASIPAALPLMVTVEPPSGTGFALRDTVRVELHTHALPYTAGSHFRLFKAPLGGQFVDITDEVAPGSVRTRGTTGGFSQFLVLVDLRSTSSVIGSKFDALQARAAAAPSALRGDLLQQLADARSAADSGQHAAAIAALDAFRAQVSSEAGLGLGNEWTPSQRSGNLAGELLAGASSLVYSIGYRRDYGD